MYLNIVFTVCVSWQSNLFNHYFANSKWPDRLAEAKNDPLTEMQLVQDCSANNEDVLLLRKEVIERSTCNSLIKNVFICYLSV